MTVKIRKALPKDSKKIVELLYGIARLHHEGIPHVFRGDFTKYTEEEFCTLLGKDDVFAFAAVDTEDQVIGYAINLLTVAEGNRARYASRYLYLDDLCVDPIYRGQGIGSLLLAESKAAARALGCDSLQLNVWHFEGSALDFYEKNGFRPLYTHMTADI